MKIATEFLFHQLLISLQSVTNKGIFQLSKQKPNINLGGKHANLLKLLEGVICS